MSDTELEEREQAAGQHEKIEGGLGADEIAKLDQMEAAWDDTTGQDNAPKRRLTLKQKIIAGGATGIVVGGFGIFSIFTGPLQAVHFAKILTGNFFARNDETGDISTRRLYNTLSGNKEKNNLGVIGGKLAEKQRVQLRNMGIESNFTNPDGKGRSTLQSLDVDITHPEGAKMYERAVGLGAKPQYPGDVPDIPEGKIRINLRGLENQKITRNLTKFSVDLSGKKGISGLLAKRRLIRLHGADFHPHNTAKKAGESIKDRYNRRKKERAERITEGTDVHDGKRTSPDQDENGDTREPDPDVADEADRVADGIDAIKNEPDVLTRRQKIKQFMKSPLFKTGATAAAIVSVTCSVKDIGKNVEQYKMDNVIKPLIRLSMNTIASGSQIQANQDMNIQEAEIANDPFYDEEEGTTAFNSRAIKAAIGEEGGTDVDPATKAQIKGAYNGDKPAVFEAIDSIPTINQICGVNNAVGNLPIIKQVGAVTNSIMGEMSKVATGKTIDDWMGELVAMIGGGAVDVLSEGENFGYLAAAGSVLGANAECIPTGCIEMTGPQTSQWKAYTQQEQLAEKNALPLRERLFDITSPNSVVGRLFIKTAPYTTSPSGAATGLAQVPFSAITGSIQSMFGVFTQKAHAYDIQDYDYGLPEFAIPLDVLESERYENVYDNLDRLEDDNFAKLKEANEKWGKCFGDPIDNEGNLTDRDVKTYEHTDDCNGDLNNPDFQDYYMYLQDANTIHTLACYESVDESSCNQIGFGDGSADDAATEDTGTSTTDVPGGGFKNTNTADMQCPTGSSDMGTRDVPTGEGLPASTKQYKIRLCKVPGVPNGVNVAIAANVMKMVADAGNAGTVLSGASFRTTASQIQLRKDHHCKDVYTASAKTCKPPTARPGTSMHEQALAIDFNNCQTHSTKCYIWLSQNAATYGLKNLKSEPWHWSTNGN